MFASAVLAVTEMFGEVTTSPLFVIVPPVAIFCILKSVSVIARAITAYPDPER